LPPEAIILLATLVARREYVEKALRSIESTGTYAEQSFGKDAISFLITAKGIKGSVVTSRHNILRK
jgi:hypothetical protein